VLGGENQPVSFQTRAAASADLLGARLIIENIADIDSRRTGATVHAIERAIAEVEPTVVYTHSVKDTGAHHVDIYDATVIAAFEIATVASYQNVTSTIDFHPTRFVAIDDVIGTKLEMLELFTGSDFVPVHLQPETVLSTARYWGRYVDSAIAEPLESIRDPKPDPTA
jgi:LmbE family N-acetylglucosaminyl deacetylase